MAMDYLLLIQAVLYYLIFISGFFVCIPVAVNRLNFNGVCILYADVRRTYFADDKYSVTGNSSICDFPIYFGVIGMIVVGFLGGALFMYFAMKSRKDAYIGERMWKLPFIPLNAALAFVTMVTACVLTVGFKVFCNSLEKLSKADSCAWFQHRTFSSGTNTGSFVVLSSFSQAGAWIGFILYMIQMGISVLRLYKNRLLQK